MRFVALGLAVAVLGGCATAPVQVTADNYCKLGRKISWSVRDTQTTITQIRKSNAVHRRICG